jgi:hypothetical protein
MQTPFSFPSPVVFVHLKAAHSFLVVLSLGWAKGLRQVPMYVRTLGDTSFSKNGQNEQKHKSLCTKAHWDIQLAYAMVLSDV